MPRASGSDSTNAPRRSPATAHWAVEAVVALGVVAASVAVVGVLEGYAGATAPPLVFLLAVLAVALRRRAATAVATAFLAFAAYGYFFVEPRRRAAIAHPADAFALAAFLLVGLVAVRLAIRVRAQLGDLRRAHRRVQATEDLARRLASAADEPAVVAACADAMSAALGTRVVVRRSDDGAPPVDAARATSVALGLARGPGILVELPDVRLARESQERLLLDAMAHDAAQAVERTRLVAELEATRVQGQADQLRTALLASVSHDLRSPLTSMIGAATSLTSGMDAMDPVARHELCLTIVEEGRRLDRYIQNLLDMTRLGVGPLTIERDWIGLDEIVASAVDRVRHAFPDVATTVSVPDDVLLHVHPALVEQALFNVLENAARFTPAGDRIRVRATAGDEGVIVDVVDRGPGIPPEERARVFDMFYSVPRGDRRSGGTGLGLTISRGMIAAHGGRVEALGGDDGVGTTVRIRLPRTLPPPGGAT